MTLEQLEVVLAIVDCGSFRAAAEKLNRSQPALSASVKNLEDEFDLKIFDRSEYRPKLTEEGVAFIHVARGTLSAAHYAARVAKELAQKKTETKIRVSVDPLAATEFIELLAQECARPTYPATLILEKSILDSSLSRLLEGQVDLSIAPCTQGDNTKIETILLESVAMVGAVSRKLLQEKRKPTQEFLNQHPQIFAYDLNQNEEPTHLPSAAKENLHQKIFVPDHFTKVKLIESGIGWGRISKKEFDACEDLVVIDKTLLSHLTMDLCLIRSRHRPLGPVGREIWAAFEKRSENSSKA